MQLHARRLGNASQLLSFNRSNSMLLRDHVKMYKLEHNKSRSINFQWPLATWLSYNLHTSPFHQEWNHVADTHKYTSGVIRKPNMPSTVDIVLQFCVLYAVSERSPIPIAKVSAGIVPTMPLLLGPTSSDINTNPTAIIPLRKNPVRNLKLYLERLNTKTLPTI